MFKKILIANRGEIACRIIESAHKMGIKTVAVYSDADVDAKHVKMADEAVHIGASAAKDSYLVINKIIDAAQKTSAEAIHPGYGFLSENTDFRNQLSDANIAFIGPDSKAIAAMGDKIESKKLAQDAQVTTVPGYMGIIDDLDEAVKISQDIGYPVMIKASAGGGGKGMRVAYNDEEVREGFQSAKNEASSSFGDDRIFIEKFIEQPRHIEIQVLGDKHGNVIHLGERECSIQRRHQKVIEEAPSSFLDPQTREAMGAQAVSLSKAVDYHSAGTVEFIVDKDKNFYFLEMNTRLQVEHPVTEQITGIDLVEQMIRIASGEALALKQEDIKIKGWSLESRIYAEDPIRGFLPSTGRISSYIEPVQSDSVRVDTGIEEGSEISLFYDPMIAKLITTAPDRSTAIDLMLHALDHYYIDGVQSNISFLSDLLKSEGFKSGEISTNYIAEHYPEGFNGGTINDTIKVKMIAAALTMHCYHVGRLSQISEKTMPDYPRYDDEWVVQVGDQYIKASFLVTKKGCAVVIGQQSLEIETDWRPGKKLFAGYINQEPVALQIGKVNEGVHLTHQGVSAKLIVRTKREAELASLMPEKLPPDMSKYLICPMPGLVINVNAREGDEIKAGQALCTIEAMKMENILRAEKDGKVIKIDAKEGDSLAVDHIIMEFE